MFGPKGHHFLGQILQEAASWQEIAKAKSWNRAGELLRKALERCKDTLSSSDNGKEKNAALLSGILIRGMQDATQLSRLSSTEGWSMDTSKIEDAWSNLCDAQDRLSYVSTFTNLTKLAWLIDRLNAMDAEFMRVLGPGMYMSPEILVKKELCSVCQQDIKGCDHIPGHLYAGVRCLGIVQDSDLKSISMVMNPRDRRCRIWPWRYKGGTRFESVVATMFRLDDFIDEP